MVIEEHPPLAGHSWSPGEPLEEEPWAGAGGAALPRGLHSSHSMPSLSRGQTPSQHSTLTNQQFKREVAYKEAMDRHVSSLEERASEVVAERQAWSQHVQECLLQERDEIQNRRMKARVNLHYLQQQIAMDEERKKERRQEEIEAASAHDFPRFTEVPESEKKDFIHGQQARVRAELDDQVRTNNTLRNLAKQRERALEVNQLEANKREMAMLRGAERAKKAYDREALATAWNSDIRMKNIWKAIETHSKAGISAPQVLLGDTVPPSRGGSTVSAGRIMTGSSRRVPLGASSSLTQLEARAASGRPVV